MDIYLKNAHFRFAVPPESTIWQFTKDTSGMEGFESVPAETYSIEALTGFKEGVEGCVDNNSVTWKKVDQDPKMYEVAIESFNLSTIIKFGDDADSFGLKLTDNWSHDHITIRYVTFATDDSLELIRFLRHISGYSADPRLPFR